jgi:cytochrome c-type biogenesis protein CcmE
MSDPKKQRRLWYSVGGILIVAFLAYGATSFKSNLTPYVSFEEAQKSSRKVQVAGGLLPNSTKYVEEDEVLKFGIVEEGGETMTVLYKGIKPGNFEEATQIVAIGTYSSGAFHADQLLVKCPSKYQGVEDAPRSYGSET